MYSTILSERRRRFAASGFTLVELAVCILLFTVGLAATISMMIAGIRIGNEVRQNASVFETALACIDDTALNDAARTLRNGYFVKRATRTIPVPEAPSDPLFPTPAFAPRIQEVTIRVYERSDAEGPQDDPLTTLVDYIHVSSKGP